MAFLKLNEVREHLRNANVHPELRKVIEALVEQDAVRRKQIFDVAENQGIIARMLNQLLSVVGIQTQQLKEIQRLSSDNVKSMEANDDLDPAS